MRLPLLGTAPSPIKLKAFGYGTIDREFPKIDLTNGTKLDMLASGGYLELYGLEIFCSNTDRTSLEAGSDPSDCGRGNMSVYAGKPGLKLIGCAIHDLGDGIFKSSAATGMEIYWCYIYNNGWAGPDRGHGHGLYLQNDVTDSTIKHCVLFSSFYHNAQLYGSDTARMNHYQILANAWINAGAGDTSGVTQYKQSLINYGGSAIGHVGHINMDGNDLYVTGGTKTLLSFGVDASTFPAEAVSFVNNRTWGTFKPKEARGYVLTGNTFTTGGSNLTGSSVLIGARLFSTDSYATFSGDWNNNVYHYPSGGGDQLPFHSVKEGVASSSTFAQWKT